jgi:hypothetical protein
MHTRHLRARRPGQCCRTRPGDARHPTHRVVLDGGGTLTTGDIGVGRGHHPATGVVALGER